MTTFRLQSQSQSPPRVIAESHKLRYGARISNRGRSPADRHRARADRANLTFT
jgi:hypothetical protein